MKDELSYLRLRAIVLREAADIIGPHCALGSSSYHARQEDAGAHDAIQEALDDLHRTADASEDAASKLEELAQRPTPGFWPQMPRPRAIEAQRLLDQTFGEPHD